MLCNESMHLRTLQVHQNFLPTSIPAIIVYQESSYTHARTQIVMRSCTTSLFIPKEKKKRASVLGKLQSLRSIKMQRCHVQTCHLLKYATSSLFAPMGRRVRNKKRKESKSQSLVYYRSTPPVNKLLHTNICVQWGSVFPCESVATVNTSPLSH